VVLGAFETTAIVVAFLALGGLLGLREGPTRSRRAGWRPSRRFRSAPRRL